MKFSMIYEAQVTEPTPAEEQRTLLEMVEQADALPASKNAASVISAVIKKSDADLRVAVMIISLL